MPQDRITDGVLYMASHRVRESADGVLGKDLVTVDQLNAAIGGIAAGAPIDARYWVSIGHAGLTQEVDMGFLGAGVLSQTIPSGIAAPVATAMQDRRVLVGGGTPAAIAQSASFQYDVPNARLILNDTGYTPAIGPSFTIGGAGDAQIGGLAGTGNAIVKALSTGRLARAEVTDTLFPLDLFFSYGFFGNTNTLPAIPEAGVGNWWLAPNSGFYGGDGANPIGVTTSPIAREWPVGGNYSTVQIWVMFYTVLLSPSSGTGIVLEVTKNGTGTGVQLVALDGVSNLLQFQTGTVSFTANPSTGSPASDRVGLKFHTDGFSAVSSGALVMSAHLRLIP